MFVIDEGAQLFAGGHIEFLHAAFCQRVDLVVNVGAAEERVVVIALDAAADIGFRVGEFAVFHGEGLVDVVRAEPVEVFAVDFIGHRQAEHAALAVEHKGSRVKVDAGLRVLDDVGVNLFWLCGVADIKERELHGVEVRAAFAAAVAHAEQQRVGDGMQVFRKAGQLHFAEDLRLRRVGKVDGEQRVGVAEGDHIGEVAEKTGGLDLLVVREVFQRADDLQAAVQHIERADVKIGLVVVIRGRYAQEALVLVNGVLVVHIAGHGAGGFERQRGAVQREGEDVGRARPAVVAPVAAEHIERVGGAVDAVAVAEQAERFHLRFRVRGVQRG